MEKKLEQRQRQTREAGGGARSEDVTIKRQPHFKGP